MGKHSAFRSQFDYDTKAASDEATIADYGESMTVQSQTEDTDINVMMKRFGVTGKMPDNPRVPQYGDFTGITDYRSALDAIREADDAFAEFTPEVRARFENNPQKVIEFMENVANRDEAIKLGLVNGSAPAPQPKAAEKISEAVSPPPAPLVP